MNIIYATNVVCYAKVTVKVCSSVIPDTGLNVSKHVNISLQPSCKQNSPGRCEENEILLYSNKYAKIHASIVMLCMPEAFISRILSLFVLSHFTWCPTLAQLTLYVANSSALGHVYKRGSNVAVTFRYIPQQSRLN